MPEDLEQSRLVLFALLKTIHPQKLPGLLQTYVTLTSAVMKGDDTLLPDQRALFDLLYRRAGDVDLPSLREDLERLIDYDVRFITIAERGYPANLRSVREAPPALFVRGTLEPCDEYSVAVVGTRQATPAGLDRAAKMARLLAKSGVTVISGLAKGIDTAAHTAALEVGGRTIAVMGTGHDTIYPAVNRNLASRIASCGALVSQFPPGSTVRPPNFANRNWVTSGMTQGTIVIEASETSGAKLQAHNAVRQGKKVFLIRSLVESQAWARRMLDRNEAIEVGEVDDVLAHLKPQSQFSSLNTVGRS